VSYSKYPPRGTRGFGPLFSAHAFGTPDNAYAPAADDSLLVIVQIESRVAVENVEEIARVDGIDLLFIGPFDLSKFLNVQFGGEEHEAAIARILKAAHAAGKTAGIFCTNGEQSKRRLEQGFDMVSVATDQAMLGAAFDRELATMRGVPLGEARSAY
jgi:4-hydroxy-2-oxoheptanedioate aldolase